MQTTASENAGGRGATLVASACGAPEKAAPVLQRRILLAEDGMFNQMLLSTILRQQGLAVEIVGNGALAVARAMEALHTGAAFDLILMDIQMPEMNGDVATAKLRAMGYPGVIVAVTADDTEVERARCIDAGCDNYLTKPIARDALIAVVKTYLSGGNDGAAEKIHTPTGDGASQAHAAIAPLYSSYADDPEMEMLVAGFVDQLPGHVAALRTAADCDDLGGMTRLAHQLSGAAGGYGFTPVSHAAAALEKAARAADNTDGLMSTLEGLAQVCAQVRK
ncbi:CheY chemotaxis protein or a CheY-like REC (receiver) domain [Roseicitreum antarcticum]|uniref:CheY chemotaxis protein or a CheY-like REC (Receiver) domain n=2 Tax=Roseicitreum antarcticum TaxID=564137 RepID=A0A1H2Z1R9_9RHOB|nr:CheY chemotaxis protein or a CheY-like REC (receiver) domain [Roseicitreum antarcticum]